MKLRNFISRAQPVLGNLLVICLQFSLSLTNFQVFFLLLFYMIFNHFSLSLSLSRCRYVNIELTLGVWVSFNFVCDLCSFSACQAESEKSFALSLYCATPTLPLIVSAWGGEGKRAGKVKCLHLSLASYENSLSAAPELPRAPFLLYCCAIYLMCCLANYAYATLSAQIVRLRRCSRV